jgi:hypothetical protein
MATLTKEANNPNDVEERTKEREALKKVKLRSFTATPPTIQALGRSMLQWSVTGLPPEDRTVNLNLFLEDEEVVSTGSKIVSPSSTHTFRLKAKGDFTDKVIGTTQVTVDFGACVNEPIAAGLITDPIEQEIDRQIGRSSKVKPRGGSTVRLENFSIVIEIPLEIEVPSWFNADMDVSLRFSLFAASERVRAVLNDVSVDVSWTFLEHLAGLGITGIIQGALEEMAKAMLELFGSLLEERIAGTLQAHVDGRIAELNSENPGNRFHLQSMQVSDLGITFRYCPAP